MTRNLDNIERIVWLKTFDDGIYDIFLGWILLWMGIVFTISHTGFPDTPLTIINVSGIAIAVFLMHVAKRRITRPRTGNVVPSKTRRRRIGVTLAIGFLLLTGAFTLSMVSWSGGKSFLGDPVAPLLHPMLLSMFLFLLFGIHAYLLEFDRLYVIAALFALTFPVGKTLELYLDIDAGILLQALPAAIIIGMGIRLLKRFMRENPVLKMQEMAEE
jgi:hypothetical protein